MEHKHDLMRDILIVDDDPIIRQGLARMIEGFEGHGNILQAGNGLEALDLVCLGRIGLVFADIKMPICNGLELLQKLSDISYRGEVVMISGFDDFEFVRMAMRLGAADYMLKPVSRGELYLAYQEAMGRLSRKGRTEDERSLPKALLEEVYTGQAWLDKLLGTPEAIEEFLTARHMTGAYGLAVALLNTFGKGPIGERDRQTAYLLGTTMQQERFPAGQVQLLQGVYKQFWVLALFYPVQEAEHAALEMVDFLRDEGISFGMAHLHRKPEALGAALEEAMRGLENFFYDLPGAGLPEAGEPAEEIAQRVTECVAAGNSQEAVEAVHALFDRIAMQKPGVEEVRRLLVSVVYSLMRRNKEFIGIIGKYKFTEMDIVHMVQEEATLSGMRKGYLNLIQMYMDALNQRRLNRDDYAIQKAKSYLENGYQGNLSLGEIAERLGLNPNYFSSLFHQKTGKTFSEYMRGVRIEKAIEMMLSTNQKMFEIALAVGYGDSAQFHRAFKQVTGVSPGVYKRRHLE